MGIGAATVLAAANAGYAVALGYHAHENEAFDLVARIRDSGGDAVAYLADVSNETDVARLFEAIDRDFGRLDALVNSAGITHQRLPLTEVAGEDIEKTIRVNLLGTIYCVRAAVPRMGNREVSVGGAIVNVSSQAASFGGNRLTAYAASKSGVNALTVGLARELGPKGIRVNAVSPGIIDTDQQARIPDVKLSDLIATLPLGRLGNPAEVASVILWLLSDSASYVSGAIVPVSGGR